MRWWKPSLGAVLRALGLLALFGVLAVAYYRYVWTGDAELFQFSFLGGDYELTQPKVLAILLAAPLLLFVLGRSLADLPWQQRVLSFVLRITFLALVALGAGHLVQTEKTDHVCTAVVLDVSDSVADDTLARAQKRIGELYEARRADDTLRLVTFAERPRMVPLTEETDDGERLIPRKPADLRHSKAGAGTNLQAAIQHARAALGSGCLRRLVVLSDGVETEGQALAESTDANTGAAKVFVEPFRDPPPSDLAVLGLELPNKVNLGEPFDVVAKIRSTRAAEAKLRLYQGPTLNSMDSVRTVTLEPGETTVRFQSVVRIGGEITYSLELEPTGEDRFEANNQYAVTVDVPGRPRVLLVEGDRGKGRYLASALTAQQLDVDVRAPGAFPGNLPELEQYAFVILSNVSREGLGRAAEGLIHRYVRDVGGGFLMAGGESSFGLGGWQGSELERILPVRMDAEKRREMPGVAMVLVIDRSGSMTGLPMEMAKEACSATVTTLRGDDLIEVIAFDTRPTRYVKMQPARYQSRIQNDILRIQPGGGTEIFQSLDMAYQDIAVVEARKKHVILLTDGNASSDGIADLVAAMLHEGITVTSVGLGSGVNEELLRMIADGGGGRYHFVPDAGSLPRVFTRETELISREAVVDDWFPARVVQGARFLDGTGITSAPLLRGYVSTQLKPVPAQLILASDQGEPLLARWRVGLGWTLAWTSDLRNAWAVDWLRWPSFGRFWAQLVREHMRHKHRTELPMKVRLEGSELVASVDALTPGERFDNHLESTLLVERGEGRSGAGASPSKSAGTGPTEGKPTAPKNAEDADDAALHADFRQIGPGRYEARVPLRGFGSFSVEAQHSRREEDGELRPVAVSFGHVSRPYPREYAVLEPNVEALERLAEATGGKRDPAAAAIFDPAGETIEREVPRQNNFIYAALLVFLLDLLVRRVRIFDRSFRSQMARSQVRRS